MGSNRRHHSSRLPLCVTLLSRERHASRTLARGHPRRAAPSIARCAGRSETRVMLAAASAEAGQRCAGAPTREPSVPHQPHRQWRRRVRGPGGPEPVSSQQLSAQRRERPCFSATRRGGAARVCRRGWLLSSGSGPRQPRLAGPGMCRARPVPERRAAPHRRGQRADLRRASLTPRLQLQAHAKQLLAASTSVRERKVRQGGGEQGWLRGQRLALR